MASDTSSVSLNIFGYMWSLLLQLVIKMIMIVMNQIKIFTKSFYHYWFATLVWVTPWSHSLLDNKNRHGAVWSEFLSAGWYYLTISWKLIARLRMSLAPGNFCPPAHESRINFQTKSVVKYDKLIVFNQFHIVLSVQFNEHVFNSACCTWPVICFYLKIIYVTNSIFAFPYLQDIGVTVPAVLQLNNS